MVLERLNSVITQRAGNEALRSGNSGIRSSKIVKYDSEVRELHISGHRKFPYQVDGDYLGDVSSLHFTYEPELMNLVIPLPEEH